MTIKAWCGAAMVISPLMIYGIIAIVLSGWSWLDFGFFALFLLSAIVSVVLVGVGLHWLFDVD